MRTTHDEIANASYTVLTDNRTVAKTIVVSEHCNVDIDAEGYPVGIEVLFTDTVIEKIKNK